MNIRNTIEEFYKNILYKSIDDEKENAFSKSKYFYFFEDYDNEPELSEILDFYEYKILTFIEETSTNKSTIDSDYIEGVMTIFLGKNNDPTSYVSFEITSYDIKLFCQNLSKNNTANIIGDSKCSSYLDAVQTLYFYSRSNPQRYILTNRAKDLLEKSLSSGETRSLTLNEFKFLRARNNFKINLNVTTHTLESPYNSYLDSLIENYLLSTI